MSLNERVNLNIKFRGDLLCLVRNACGTNADNKLLLDNTDALRVSRSTSNLFNSSGPHRNYPPQSKHEFTYCSASSKAELTACTGFRSARLPR